MNSPFLEKRIIDCTQVFLTDTSQFLAITGSSHEDRIFFLEALSQNEKFSHMNTTFIELTDEITLLENLQDSNNAPYDVCFIVPGKYNFSQIRTVIEQHLIDSKIIFVSGQEVSEKNVTNFVLTNVTFREFSEENGIQFSVPQILEGSIDGSTLKSFAEHYLYTGAFLQNIEQSDLIIENFYQKRTDIEQYLYEKERDTFEQFLRVLAMNVGELVKEDLLAKMCNTTRRKVKKYLDLLVEQKIITFISSFYTDKTKELSLHEKIYFTDLSFLFGILDASYTLGNQRNKILENFVYLSLLRKVGETHTIQFWRKKSGTQISFVLIDHTTKKLTPIEVAVGTSHVIPRTIFSFYDTYGGDVEYGMYLNEDFLHAEAMQLADKSFLMLPFAVV